MPMSKEELDEYLNNVLQERKAAKDTKGNLGLIGGMAQISNNQGTLFDPKRGPSVAAGMAKQYGEDVDSDIDNRTKVADYLLGKKTQEGIAEDNRKASESREDLKFQRDKELQGANAQKAMDLENMRGNKALSLEKLRADKALALEQEKAKHVKNPNQKTDQETTYRYNSLVQNAQKLKDLIKKNGTVSLTGTAGEEMDSKIYQMAVDFAKMVDPDSVAREGEVAAAQKYMVPVRNMGGMAYSNKTAMQLVDKYVGDLEARLEARNKAKVGELEKFDAGTGESPGFGTAIAAPSKAPEEMSDEELDAELAKLKGKK